MPNGQANPPPLGVGIEVRGPFTGQVGQEEEALRARARQGRLRGQDVVRIDSLLLAPGDLGLAQLVAKPPETAAGGEHYAHQVPGTRHRVAAALQAAQRVKSRLVGVCKNHARGPDHRRDHPLADDPVAHRSGRLVPPSPDHRSPFGNSGRLESGLAHHARHLGTFVTGRQERGIDLELAQQLATPATVDDVQQQGAGGVAHLGCESAGQPVTDVILGKKDLAHPIPVRRLNPADPEQLGGGEARERRVSHHLHQRLAASGSLFDLAALDCGSLIIPQERRADHSAGLVKENRAMHLPAQANALHIGRGEGCRGQHRLHGLDRRVPPELGVLLRPARVGVRTGILGRGRREDRPPVVEGERLGSRCADIDAQSNAHFLISQRSPHGKMRGSTAAGSRRASASNTSTATVLNVNMS